MNFNDADPQQSYNLIPKGTIAKVHLTIKPGGFNDPTQEWIGTEGYATCNASGAVYLNCEFIVRGGLYDSRRIWNLIGLHSPKGAMWNDIGRSFIRAILNSARGFSSRDESPEAVAARNIKSYAELDGIEFIARIGVEKDTLTEQERNVIKIAVTKDHKDYPGNPIPTANLQTVNAAAEPFPAWAR
jgi:hypothetical protein